MLTNISHIQIAAGLVQFIQRHYAEVREWLNPSLPSVSLPAYFRGQLHEAAAVPGGNPAGVA